MSSSERVTVVLPTEIVRDTDQLERDSNRFILQAVQRELSIRRHADLRRSLESSHSDTGEVTERGFADWARSLPQEDTLDLVDPQAGSAVSWVPGKGWVETEK